MSAMEIVIDSTAQSSAVLAVAVWTKLTTESAKVVFSADAKGRGATPFVVSPETGDVPVVFDVATIVRLIARKQGPSKFLGSTPQMIGEVEEWLHLHSVHASGADTKGLLERLDAHLASRTFVAGHSLSIADIVIYSLIFHLIQAKTLAWKDSDSDKYMNVYRWFTHMQHQREHKLDLSTLPAATKAAIACNTIFCHYFKASPAQLPLSAKANEDRALLLVTPPTPPAAAAPKEVAVVAKVKKVDKILAAKPAAQKADTTTPASTAKTDDKVEKKAPKAAATTAAAPAAAAAVVGGKCGDIHRCMLKVAQILSTAKHPTDERLTVCQLKLGDEPDRQIVCGFGDLDVTKLANSLVVVWCNLKAGPVKEQDSHGRIMLATNESQRAIITPPISAKIGERVSFPGVDASLPIDEPVGSKNVSKILKGFAVTGGQANYMTVPLTTSAGLYFVLFSLVFVLSLFLPLPILSAARILRGTTLYSSMLFLPFPIFFCFFPCS